MKEAAYISRVVLLVEMVARVSMPCLLLRLYQ